MSFPEDDVNRDIRVLSDREQTQRQRSMNGTVRGYRWRKCVGSHRMSGNTEDGPASIDVCSSGIRNY